MPVMNRGYFGQPPTPTIPGKFIRSTQEIVANDVPGDGGIAAFIMQDLSSVFLKQWNNNGYIDTLRYVPDRSNQPYISSVANAQNVPVQNSNQQPESPPSNIEKDILERLNKIEAILSDLMSPSIPKEANK